MTDIARPHIHASTQELLLKFSLFWAMKSGAMNRFMLPLLEQAVAWHHPLVNKIAEAALRHTALNVFFGGATLEETMKTSRLLMAQGTGVIIDYAAPEGAMPTDLAKLEKTLEHIVEEYCGAVRACEELNQASQHDHTEAALAVKISTLAPKPLLEKLGKLLLEDREAILSGEDAVMFRNIQARAEQILAEAASRNVRCYIDAEESWINPVIERVCCEAIVKDRRPTVTVQAYLKNSGELVNRLLSLPNPPDIKLVRGAYIGLERERPSIWESKEQTDRHYDELLKRLHQDGRIQVITVASHNQESLRLAGTLAGSQTELYSATLLGMGDTLDSGSLPRAKYVPYPQRADETEAPGLWFKRGTAHVIGNMALLWRSELTEHLLQHWGLKGDDARARYGHPAVSPVLGAVAYFGRRGIEFTGSAGPGMPSRGDMEFQAVKKEISTRLGHGFMNMLEGICQLQNHGMMIH